MSRRSEVRWPTHRAKARTRTWARRRRRRYGQPTQPRDRSTDA